MLKVFERVRNLQVDSPALEVHHEAEHEHRGEELGDVGQVVAPEGLAKRLHLRKK